MSNVVEKTKATTDEGEEKEMTFVEHLDELRSHLVRITISVLAAAVFLFFATQKVFELIIFGPVQKDFLTYKLMCKLSYWAELGDRMCYVPSKIDFQTFEMGEAFLMHIKVCFMGGIMLAFPYILWEVWKFISPALYQKERSTARGVVGVSSFLFLLGIGFGYFVLAPFAINFLVNYSLPMVNEGSTIIKANSFINYMIMFTMPVGIVFELPIAVYYLAKLGLITDEGMRNYRKHAIVAILVLAAFVTPPDVMTQVLIGVPIYLLYEISIFVAARETRRYQNK